MQKKIKTNLKLASLYATMMMTLSGCGTKYTNVIENVSSDKLLVKDVADGKQRIIELGKNATKYLNEGFKYFHVGDTIFIVEEWSKCGYQNDRCILVYDSDYHNQYRIVFNKELLFRRTLQERIQQEQAEFDSLKCILEKQR